MEEFKKKLQKNCGKRMIGAFLCVACAGLFLIIGLAETLKGYAVFDPLSGGYAKLDVTFVMGPFAELSNGNSTTEEYYIAQGSDTYWYVVGMNKNTKLPVYGEDVSVEDADSLKSQEIKGNSKPIPSEMVPYLVEYLAGTDVNESNYADYIGNYYLDTTSSRMGDNYFYFIIAGIFALLAVVLFGVVIKKKREVKARIELLEQSGQLQVLYQDFMLREPIFSNKLKLALSAHYILDYSVQKEGFIVFPLNHVTNVYKCNMIQGEPTIMNYIALETNDGQRYCIAPCSGRPKEFDEMIAKLKMIVSGGTL